MIMTITSTFLQCLAICCTALFAGGIFVFPLLAPALIEHLKLTQPQLSTIALAGLAGQYPFSSVVGKLIDRYGPRLCSFVAALMFSVAFGLSALELSLASEYSDRSNAAAAQRLTVYFAMAGLGTVSSYFSFVFSATKTFTSYLTVASGITMSLFGLSPLFLSYIASNFFTDSSSGSLDASGFLKFLAISAGIIHLAATYALTVPSATTTSVSMSSEEHTPNEQSRLLENEQEQACTTDPRDGSTLDLLRDVRFWLLALYMVMILGACEMVMANVGTIVLSLPSSLVTTVKSNAENFASLQVRILSLSNTLARLMTGPLADFVSPVFTYQRLEGFVTVRRHRISRIVFLSGAALLQALTCAWMVFGVQTVKDIWVLSVGTGITYGMVFTVLPGIACSIWGIRNLARNFGVITYSPFVGTTIYSYFYALVVARHSPEGLCRGTICWISTFYFCLATSVAGLAITIILWRHWSGRI